MDPSSEQRRKGFKGRRWRKPLLERMEEKEYTRGMKIKVITRP